MVFDAGHVFKSLKNRGVVENGGKVESEVGHVVKDCPCWVVRVEVELEQ